MKIPVAGLGEGVYEHHFDQPASSLGLGGDFSDVHVDARLEKTADELHLEARIHTAARFVCDRCLAEFTRTLESGYSMHYLYSEAEAARFDPAEVQVIAPGTPSIDLGEDVRQTVLVAVPLKLLCRESCKGLCPTCGKNLNEGPCDCRPEPQDSRWDALKTLRRPEPQVGKGASPKPQRGKPRGGKGASPKGASKP